MGEIVELVHLISAVLLDLEQEPLFLVSSCNGLWVFKKLFTKEA